MRSTECVTEGATISRQCSCDKLPNVSSNQPNFGDEGALALSQSESELDAATESPPPPATAEIDPALIDARARTVLPKDETFTKPVRQPVTAGASLPPSAMRREGVAVRRSRCAEPRVHHAHISGRDVRELQRQPRRIERHRSVSRHRAVRAKGRPPGAADRCTTLAIQNAQVHGDSFGASGARARSIMRNAIQAGRPRIKAPMTMTFAYQEG